MPLAFTDDEWAVIAQQLLRNTKSDVIVWDIDREDAEMKVFATKMRSGRSFHLAAKDADDRFPFILSAVDAEGKILSSFVTQGYNEDYLESAIDAASSRIDTLYSLVNRKVSGAAETAKSLLDELAGLGSEEDAF